MHMIQISMFSCGDIFVVILVNPYGLPCMVFRDASLAPGAWMPPSASKATLKDMGKIDQ